MIIEDIWKCVKNKIYRIKENENMIIKVKFVIKKQITFITFLQQEQLSICYGPNNKFSKFLSIPTTSK